MWWKAMPDPPVWFAAEVTGAPPRRTRRDRRRARAAPAAAPTTATFVTMRRAMARARRNPAGVLGVLTGVAIVVVLLATGALAVPLRYGDRDASAEFLAAWKR